MEKELEKTKPMTVSEFRQLDPEVVELAARIINRKVTNRTQLQFLLKTKNIDEKTLMRTISFLSNYTPTTTKIVIGLTIVNIIMVTSWLLL